MLALLFVVMLLIMAIKAIIRGQSKDILAMDAMLPTATPQEQVSFMPYTDKNRF